jgi:hypothetical protein
MDYTSILFLGVFKCIRVQMTFRLSPTKKKNENQISDNGEEEEVFYCLCNQASSKPIQGINQQQ